jgi:hypothetical protein
MMFRDIVKGVSGVCCAAVMCCGGVGEVRGMDKSDEVVGNVKQNRACVPIAGMSETERLAEYSNVVACLFQACSELDNEAPLSDEGRDSVLANLGRAARFASRYEINLDVFHSMFGLLFLRHYWVIVSALDEGKFPEYSLLNLMDIIQILPEVIKSPWVQDPNQQLIEKISKICLEFKDDVKNFAKPESYMIIAEYGSYLHSLNSRWLMAHGISILD